MVITMVWSRLTHYGTSGTSRVPTLWIVLGPLGQSITAAGLLGANARLAVDPQLADGMNVFAVLFGVPVWGFAVLWIALAGAWTVHTARAGMPFALTWCSQRPPPPPFGAVADLCGNPVGASWWRCSPATNTRRCCRCPALTRISVSGVEDHRGDSAPRDGVGDQPPAGCALLLSCAPAAARVAPARAPCDAALPGHRAPPPQRPPRSCGAWSHQ